MSTKTRRLRAEVERLTRECDAEEWEKADALLATAPGRVIVVGGRCVRILRAPSAACERGDFIPGARPSFIVWDPTDRRARSVLAVESRAATVVEARAYLAAHDPSVLVPATPDEQIKAALDASTKSEAAFAPVRAQVAGLTKERDYALRQQYDLDEKLDATERADARDLALDLEARAAEAERQIAEAIVLIQRHQPPGSPPGGNWVDLLGYVLDSLNSHKLEAEDPVKALRVAARACVKAGMPDMGISMALQFAIAAERESKAEAEARAEIEESKRRYDTF